MQPLQFMFNLFNYEKMLLAEALMKLNRIVGLFADNSNTFYR